MTWHDGRVGGQTMMQRKTMQFHLTQGTFFGVATFLGWAKLGKGGDAPGKKVIFSFRGMFAAIAATTAIEVAAGAILYTNFMVLYWSFLSAGCPIGVTQADWK
jgi:hypothetical protein